MSRDIFGDDGLAELNEALRQLEDIKLSLNTGSFIKLIFVYNYQHYGTWIKFMFGNVMP